MKKRISYTLAILGSITISGAIFWAGCGGSSSSSSGSSGTPHVKAWGTAELIEDNNDGLAFGSHIAVDPAGNAIAVWAHLITANSICANRYQPGTGWGAFELLETDDTNPASQVQISADANGNAIVVWRQASNGKNSIWANRYISGTGWAGPELLETDDAGAASVPQIAVGPAGNAIAVWKQVTDTKYSILANHYISPTGWSGPELLETDNVNVADSPQIAIDSNGNAIVVWKQFYNSVDSIWANYYISGTGWAGPELLETDNTYTAYEPQAAIDPNGNAIAIWYQEDGVGTSIWANRYEPGAGWDGPELLETDDDGAAEYPRVAIGFDGNAIAVWKQITNSYYSIFTNRYISGTGWGVAELLETSDDGAAEFPQIAIGSDGNAMAAWAQITDTAYSIFANRYISGTGWAGPVPLETDDVNAAYDIQIAIDASGNVISVWQQTDGTRFNIWSNKFE